MSILLTGASFNNEVDRQINARHKIYGSINKTQQDISYLYSNTSWVKLVSSVNINNNELEKDTAFKSLDLSNDDKVSSNLAKKYVLSGGVKGVADNSIFDKTWGDTINTPNLNPTTYGIGGSKKLGGIRPMPGITSANIKVEPGGSIKTVTVNIKANNIFQFNIIDLLYMKVGYHMLIEWGHSKILNNDLAAPEKYINKDFSLEPEFLKGVKYTELLEKIQTQRKDSYGNYDAVVGIVINFNWTFDADGTYNITLTLKTIGEIIESIKLNLNSPSNESDNITKKLIEEIDLLKNTKKGVRPLKTFKENSNISYMQDATLDETKDPVSITLFDKARSFRVKINDDFRNYIRFGYFLRTIIQGELNEILQPKSLQVIISKVQEDYFMYVPSFLIPTDFTKCLVRLNHKINPKEYTDLQSEINVDIMNYDELNKFDTLYYEDKINNLNYYYGSIEDIYVNIDTIIGIISRLSNNDTNNNTSNTKKDKVPFTFLELIRAICDECSFALGNSTTLYPIFEPDTNVLSINSSTQMPFFNEFLTSIKRNFSISPPSKFLVYETGSFITNFDFNSTISSDLGMMVFMGAVQSQNNLSLPPQASGLQKLNAGIEDRIMKKSTTDITPTSSLTPTGETIDPIENYKTYIADFTRPPTGSIKFTIFYDSTKKVIESPFNLTNIINYAENIKNDKLPKEFSGVGFLPFKANITLLGLSGIKAYQRFSIAPSLLPVNYDKVDFIINTIEHKIEDNKWTTTMTTLTIPKRTDNG